MNELKKYEMHLRQQVVNFQKDSKLRTYASFILNESALQDFENLSASVLKGAIKLFGICMKLCKIHVMENEWGIGCYTNRFYEKIAILTPSVVVSC